MPLQIKITKTPLKYLESLDKPTRKRISDKLDAIARDPLDPRLSKRLAVDTRRTARVGDYRIIFEIDGDLLIVDEIGPRGQIYRTLRT